MHDRKYGLFQENIALTTSRFTVHVLNYIYLYRYTISIRTTNALLDDVQNCVCFDNVVVRRGQLGAARGGERERATWRNGGTA